MCASTPMRTHRGGGGGGGVVAGRHGDVDEPSGNPSEAAGQAAVLGHGHPCRRLEVHMSFRRADLDDGRREEDVTMLWEPMRTLWRSKPRRRARSSRAPRDARAPAKSLEDGHVEGTRGMWCGAASCVGSSPGRARCPAAALRCAAAASSGRERPRTATTTRRRRRRRLARLRHGLRPRHERRGARRAGRQVSMCRRQQAAGRRSESPRYPRTSRRRPRRGVVVVVGGGGDRVRLSFVCRGGSGDGPKRLQAPVGRWGAAAGRELGAGSTPIGSSTSRGCDRHARRTAEATRLVIGASWTTGRSPAALDRAGRRQRADSAENETAARWARSALKNAHLPCLAVCQLLLLARELASDADAQNGCREAAAAERGGGGREDETGGEDEAR